jgi:hypothetical protein
MKQGMRPCLAWLSRPFFVDPDGERFIVVQGVDRGRNDSVVVENWFDELEPRR